MGLQGERNQTGEAIDSTGTIATFFPSGRYVIDITLTATATATFEVQVADDDESSWETAKTYSSTSSISDTLEGAGSKVRLQITTAASNGATADYHMGVAK